MKTLVSILIPAYNAESTIAETLESAIVQTWRCKEIIVVDDGSTDRTAEVASEFTSKGVKVVSTENKGLCGAVNYAYSLCQGDYIQELDSDDLLAPDKIERQLATLAADGSKWILLSSSWAYFYYRTSRARFIPTSLWQDLSPVEWLLRKMNENQHMQNANWLVSRELAEAAGPWDTRLHYDQDGEYFARTVAACEGIRFVREAKIFYRLRGISRISYVGNSDIKKNSLLLSIALHIQYIRSLEDSERVRRACLSYLQNWYPVFCPHRPDLVAAAQALAAELQGCLEVPRLRRKYAWMIPILGLGVAQRTQERLPELKSSLVRYWDKAMYERETRKKVLNQKKAR
jgi:glycosyltransferase involved in cell wall biosynthesis